MNINIRKPIVSIAAIVLPILILFTLTGCGGGGTPASHDRAYAVAMQSDGKIVVAGDTYSDNNGWSFALARYNSNGGLDTSFGGSGKVLTNLGAGARAVAIQSDGKIIVAGISYIQPEYFVLVRYTSSGSLDTSFGTGGIVQTSMGGGVTSVAIQNDKKIVAAGYSYNGYGYDFALARYDINGRLDGTFGLGTGKVFTPIGGMGGGASSVAIQSNGNIVVAGGFYLIRYDSNGIPDINFGSYGIITTNSSYEQTSVAIQPDDKILVAGNYYSTPGWHALALTRRNKLDGLADFSFDYDGTVTAVAISSHNLATTSVVVESGGNIVTAGYSQYEFVLARYNSSGIPDSSFATGGVILTSAGAYWNNDSFVRAIAVQTDQKIILTGSSYNYGSNGYDFALARLNSNGSLDTGFGAGGKVITGF